MKPPAPTDAAADPVDALRDLAAPEPPALPAALAAELDRHAPVGPRRPRRQLAIAAAVSLAYAAMVLLVVSTRRDLAHLPRVWLVSFALAWLIGFAAPLYLVLVPRAGSMMPRWRLGGALAAVAAVAFVAAGFVFPRSAEGSLQLGLAHGHACLTIGLATALVPVVLGTLLLRGAAPVGSRWTAAALGAAGGGLGGLVLHFHCSITDGVHVGLIHGGVVACAALLAAALVPRALRPR